MPQPELNRIMRCGHCGNLAPMEVLQRTFKTQDYEDPSVGQWHVGYAYALLGCFSCSNVVLERTGVHTGVDAEGIDGPFDILYPAEAETPSGLPAEVSNAFNAALAIRRIDANAFAVLLGRVLEIVCQERKAKGKTLDERIKDLAARNEIPPNLAEVAHGLRKIRNLGAHVDKLEVNASDAPLLESLCRAILVYLYTAPALVEMVRKKLDSAAS